MLRLRVNRGDLTGDRLDSALEGGGAEVGLGWGVEAGARAGGASKPS